MKGTNLFKYLLPLTLALNGCGVEVIEMDLPKALPKLVVEGKISSMPGPQKVKLSWSNSFNEELSRYEGHALVIISDSGGARDTLKHEEKGEYTSELKGISGRSYQLEIHLDGKKYEAGAYMPPPAKIDSISMEFLPKSFIREEGYYISVYGLDTQEQEGYYRWMVWVNDSLDHSSIPGYLATHQLNDHNSPLYIQYPTPFKKGDHVRIQTIKMDREVYTYYQGIRELSTNDGGFLGPVPANPQTNISGGALGVFQAISITEHTFFIQ